MQSWRKSKRLIDKVIPQKFIGFFSGNMLAKMWCSNCSNTATLTFSKKEELFFVSGIFIQFSFATDHNRHSFHTYVDNACPKAPVAFWLAVDSVAEHENS